MKKCVCEECKTKRFLDHLEYATKIVNSWPEWKQNVLGKPSPQRKPTT